MKSVFAILIIAITAQVGFSQSENSFGIVIGQSSIIGDIRSEYFNGVSSEIYYKQKVNSFLNYEPSLHFSRNHGLSEELFVPGIISSTNWFPSYRNTNFIIFQNFSSSINLWSDRLTIEPKIGIGIGNSKTKLDVLDSNNMPYNNIEVESGFLTNDQDFLANIREIHDGTYETQAFENKGLINIRDDKINIYYTVAIRILYDFSNSFSIGFNHSYILQNSDYLDGVKFGSESIRANSADIIQSSQILFEYRFSSYNTLNYD